MIYVVDEDIVQLQALVAVLEVIGLDVTQIDNADDALESLTSASDVALVLIDVMLGTRDADQSTFSRKSTQDFLVTGLELADRLAKSGNPAFPSRIAFLSMASRPHVVSQIKEKSKELGIPFFDKREIAKGVMEFAEKIKLLVENQAKE